ESEKRILDFPEIVNQISELYESQVKFSKYSTGLIFSLHGNEINKLDIYSFPFILSKNKKKFISKVLEQIVEIDVKYLPFICLIGTEKFNLREDKNFIIEKLGSDITYSTD